MLHMKYTLHILFGMTSLTACWQVKQSIPLPYRIETTAIVQQWQDDLWLLINQAGPKQTKVLKINTNGTVEEVASLPLLASSIAICGTNLLVVGANADGQPTLLSLTPTGTIAWTYIFPEAKYLQWPVAACAPAPIVAWQQQAGQIEVGQYDLAQQSMISLPPLALANDQVQLRAEAAHLWVTQPTDAGTEIIDLATPNRDRISILGKEKSSLRIGDTPAGIYFSWVAGREVYFQGPGTAEPTVIADFANKTNGLLQVRSGGAPLLWLQNQTTSIDGETGWQSIIKTPTATKYQVDDFLFDVTWWNQNIAIVKATGVFLLAPIQSPQK